jgi:triphosphoribosyl-dephospho-CoA synthase
MENKETSQFNREVALAAQTACILEADAPKVGNVNRFHDFADVTLEDFHLSALAIGSSFGKLAAAGVGKTIAAAVRATREAVVTNTNLGMLLLLAPLGMAWCRMRDQAGRSGADGNTGNEKAGSEKTKNEWTRAVEEVLRHLTAEDTAYVYQAIRAASPAGMGRVEEYDVLREAPPRIPLVEAMRPAAKRDLIARQYCEQFDLVLGFGLKTLRSALTQGLPLSRAIAQTHLTLLGRVQDSLIARKLGTEWSTAVQTRAGAVCQAGGWLTVEGREKIRELDRWLRQDGHKLNPGTTADLTAAILFVYLLENNGRKRGC